MISAYVEVFECNREVDECDQTYAGGYQKDDECNKRDDECSHKYEESNHKYDKGNQKKDEYSYSAATRACERGGQW